MIYCNLRIIHHLAKYRILNLLKNEQSCKYLFPQKKTSVVDTHAARVIHFLMGLVY